MASVGDLAKRYVELIQQKKTAGDIEKTCSKEMAILEDQLIEAMADAGLQNLKTEDGVTLYRKVDKFYGPASGETDEESKRIKAEFIKELGRHPCTMDLVEPNYNTISLRARFKEMESNGETIPAELMRMLRITEKDRVGYRS